MNNYIPPFTITNNILERISSIMKKIGKIDNYKDLNKMPVIRRNNRIKSIHSSLAIEANSLSLIQVKDVIDGKIVIGPKKEIQEVPDGLRKVFRSGRQQPLRRGYSAGQLRGLPGAALSDVGQGVQSRLQKGS